MSFFRFFLLLRGLLNIKLAVMKGKPAVVLNIPSQNYLFIQEGGPYPKRHICGTGGTGIYLR
jgi:hypothetical protein